MRCERLHSLRVADVKKEKDQEALLFLVELKIRNRRQETGLKKKGNCCHAMNLSPFAVSEAFVVLFSLLLERMEGQDQLCIIYVLFSMLEIWPR